MSGFLWIVLQENRKQAAESDTSVRTSDEQIKEKQFEDDSIDKFILDHTFPCIPSIVVDAVKSHIAYIKKFAYYEGRIILLNRAKNEKVPLNGIMLSSLDFGKLAAEHQQLGSLINTKYEPEGDFIEKFSQEISSLENQRDIFKAKLKESRILLRVMLEQDSYDTIIDMLDRTSNDIKSNVGKSNDNLYRNYVAAFNQEKLLGFRWRSFLRDISKQTKKMELSEAFKSLTVSSSRPFTSTYEARSSSPSSSVLKSKLKDFHPLREVQNIITVSSSSMLKGKQNKFSALREMQDVPVSSNAGKGRSLSGTDTGLSPSKNLKRKFDVCM